MFDSIQQVVAAHGGWQAALGIPASVAFAAWSIWAVARAERGARR